MWKNGRQSGGYQVITLIKKGFQLGNISGFDLYLIRYNEGDSIPPHIDDVDGNEHHRFNLILKNPKEGGQFNCEKYFKFWRLIYFRPDKYVHSVSKCIGSRYILSFGFCLKRIIKSI